MKFKLGSDRNFLHSEFVVPTVRCPRERLSLMRTRIIGLLSFLGAALYLFLWELTKSYFFDRILHTLNPYIDAVPLDRLLQYGPPSALAALGFWLFFKTGTPQTESTKRVLDAREYADAIPNVRVADDVVAWGLFEASERDELIPLLEDGKIKAWGRLGNGHPPLTKIPSDIWRTNYLVRYPAPRA